MVLYLNAYAYEFPLTTTWRMSKLFEIHRLETRIQERENYQQKKTANPLNFIVYKQAKCFLINFSCKIISDIRYLINVKCWYYTGCFLIQGDHFSEILALSYRRTSHLLHKNRKTKNWKRVHLNEMKIEK